MGQQSCKRFFNHPISMPKCQLLNQQLLSEFVLPDKQNYQSLSVMSISYIPEAAKLPAKYTDLLIALKSMKWKFEDSFYDRQVGIQWRRLSQSKSIEKIPQPLSKFCQIIKFIIKSYPDLVASIKPVYLCNSGFAVCKLWINGSITEVIIDDYLPVHKISYDVEPWVLLLEKSMSKVLGSYKYLQDFSAGQIFTEITGIPHYQNEEKGQWSPGQKYQRDYEANNFKNFKQALKCDELLFETKRFSEDSSIFGYHENYKISHISFQGLKCKASLIKMTVQEKQSISIRVIQPLEKYKQNYQNQLSSYNNLLFECFIQKNGNFSPFGNNHQINNCIYLNSVFTNIQPGNYLFYLHPIKQDSKLNIIGYSKTNLKFTEIYNQGIINKVIFSHLKSPSSSQQQHLGSQVFAHIQHNHSQVALFFSQNFPAKTLRLEILNYVLFLQQNPKLAHQVSLNEVKDKWIIILSSNHNQKVKRNCFSII